MPSATWAVPPRGDETSAGAGDCRHPTSCEMCRPPPTHGRGDVPAFSRSFSLLRAREKTQIVTSTEPRLSGQCRAPMEGRDPIDRLRTKLEAYQRLLLDQRRARDERIRALLTPRARRGIPASGAPELPAALGRHVRPRPPGLRAATHGRLVRKHDRLLAAMRRLFDRPIWLSTRRRAARQLYNHLVRVRRRLGLPAPEPPHRDWYRVSEAAVFLGVSWRTLWRWVASGKLRCHRSPGRHRFFEYRELVRRRNGQRI